MICKRQFFAAGSAVGLAVVLLVSASGAARRQAAQQPAPPVPQQPSTGPAIRSNVELVVVPVTVKDSKGNLVGDVQRDEFRIFEDGIEQRISLFSVDPVPLSVVIAVDGDLKPGARDRVQKSLVSMAGGFASSDEVAVGRFDAFYTPLLDFTTSSDRLITELKHIDMKVAFSQGSSPVTLGPTINGGNPVPGAPSAAQIPNNFGKSTKHINDAMYEVAELLRARDPGRRRMVILVSDGTNAKNNTHSYDEALRALLSANVSVYAIGVDQAIILRGTTILSHLAHATGGDVYYAAGESVLPDFYERVTEESRHQYTLGYVPAQTDRAKSYHSIEVRIRRPGLTLLTRDGYYSAGAKP